MGSSACKPHDLPTLYSRAFPSTRLYLRWTLLSPSLPFFLVGYTSWPTPEHQEVLQVYVGVTWPSSCAQDGFCLLFPFTLAWMRSLSSKVLVWLYLRPPWAVRAGEAGILLSIQAVCLAPTYVPEFLNALMSFCPPWKPHVCS